MLFNSYLFIFIFLPIVLIGWFSLNKIKKYKLAEVFLIGMSLWFYAYFNFSYLFIIVGSCLFNFLISYFINRIEKKKSLDIDNIVSDFEKNIMKLTEGTDDIYLCKDSLKNDGKRCFTYEEAKRFIIQNKNKNTIFLFRSFFIHCESNGISSTIALLSLYLISPLGLYIITL
mgnify:CR=1 FL=1